MDDKVDLFAREVSHQDDVDGDWIEGHCKCGRRRQPSSMVQALECASCSPVHCVAAKAEADHNLPVSLAPVFVQTIVAPSKHRPFEAPQLAPSNDINSNRVDR